MWRLASVNDRPGGSVGMAVEVGQGSPAGYVSSVAEEGVSAANVTGSAEAIKVSGIAGEGPEEGVSLGRNGVGEAFIQLHAVTRMISVAMEYARSKLIRWLLTKPVFSKRLMFGSFG
jgi:hypothetical protein